jgi:ATP/maltotriose-dependent transcriptional regulator MalT
MNASIREEALERGREAYRQRSWLDAYRQLSVADGHGPLAADDLWAFASAAYLTGHDDEGTTLLERTHRAYLDTDRPRTAARCAFWLGFRLADRGETGQATGWFGRAQRLLAQEGEACVEQGYMWVPVIQRQLASGDPEAAYAAAQEAAGIGRRFGDADLSALALHGQGRARLRAGRVEEGLALLDEAMVAVTGDELSPIVSGVIYCSVIGACHEVYAVRRAHEWTMALTRWCESQPDLVPFSGQCRVHRSEVMQFRGEWREALEEARSAQARAGRAEPRRVSAGAWYQAAELHRLLGQVDDAEAAYRQAARLGREPQPGLALLWWTRGASDDALAAIERVAREASLPHQKSQVLPAYLQLMLAAGRLDDASHALAELERLAETYRTEVLTATVAEGRGALALAHGDAHAALPALRTAWHAWQGLEAPYEAARTRERIAAACRAAGDAATAELELSAARATYLRLGAAPDLARLDEAAGGARPHPHDLTQRELEVLRLLAAGSTNPAIARALGISRRTVDRHVSNVFDKLGVSSRAAATARAYERHLL